MRKHYSHYLIAYTVGVLLSISTATAQAAKYQSSTSIKQVVNNFLSIQNNSKHFKISKIDKRLRLKSCSNNLKANFPQYAQQIGRTTVEVQCNSSKPWKILITVYIKKYMNVLTAKHSLPSGSTLQASDLKVSLQDVSQISGGYFTNVDQMTHMVLRRAIKPGRIFSPAMLKPKRLVNQGDEVMVLAETGNLSIRVKGKALMNGFLGQRIRVKNVNSRRVFQATVVSNGLVKVNM